MFDRKNIHILITSGAALALSALSSQAQLVPNPVSGDLYLAFRASGGTGGATSYIVKIGSDTTFRTTTPGSTITVSALGDIAADLSATYGAGWSNRADLFWGIFGVRPSTSSIVYGSRERSTPSSPTTGWPALDATSRNTTASQITSVLESVGGYKGREATTNSSVATFQPNSALASSYFKQVATAGTNDFGSLSEWSSIEGDFGAGANGTVLDLYRIAGSGVSQVGAFSLSSAGVFRFTAYASPTVDTDGDRSFDAEEVLAGTSVTDPTDFFKVEALSKAPGSVGIGFKTIPSRNYQIYYTPDLVTQPWQLIDTVAGGGAPELIQYQDSNPTRTSLLKGFYKVAVTP